MGRTFCIELLLGRWAGFRRPGGHHVKVFFRLADAADSDAIGLWNCAVPGLVSPTKRSCSMATLATHPLASGSVLCRRLGVPSGWAAPWTCCSHQPLVSEYAARYPLRGRFLRQISELPSSDECPNSCSSTSALPHAAMTLPSEPTTTLAKAYHALDAPSGPFSCAELELERTRSSRADTRDVEPRRP